MRGRTALVTGASSGLGEGFARRLAAEGAALVLTARRRPALDALAAELRRTHGTEVAVLPADLAASDGAAGLADRLAADGTRIDVLVNNAGFGAHGVLAHSDPDRLAAMIQVNVAALTVLTARLLPGMVERRAGIVLNLASTAAMQPLPNMAVYAATKAYVLAFSEAVAVEAAPAGVRVLAVSPGPTATEFFDVASDRARPSGSSLRSVDQVVATTFAALGRGRTSVVDGAFNTVQSVAPRLLPRHLVARVAGRVVGG